jgi:hypothetical protein
MMHYERLSRLVGAGNYPLGSWLPRRLVCWQRSSWTKVGIGARGYLKIVRRNEEGRDLHQGRSLRGASIGSMTISLTAIPILR